MNKKNILTVALSTILVMQFGVIVYAQGNDQPVYKFGTQAPVSLHDEQIKVSPDFETTKEQFRGVWVSTVANIDFPSKETLRDGVITKDEYMEDYNKILDRAEELNLNALIVQVSPMLDAWYKSEVNPWSQYLSGKQGQEPGYGDWDSMKWMVEETHKRGLEFHAWFNPYRVTNNSKDERGKDEKLAELSEDNFAKKNPDLVYEFEGRLYLDPGRNEVIEHINDTVKEVINKYDVDAIHFDDYFYPYQYASKVKVDENPPDKKTFEEFSSGEKNIDEWRRNNINKMIQSVDKIVSENNEKNKKSIEFGISPFGIWGHADETNDVGSHTDPGAISSYNDYVDSLKWVKEGWVDYLIPQIYWSFANDLAPYGELTDWWANKFSEVEESHLYIGHANYKYLNALEDSDWKNSDEIALQLRFNQKYNSIKGEAFFSYKNISKYPDGEKKEYDISNESINGIQEKYFNLPVNIPAKPWLDNIETKPIKKIEIDQKDNTMQLKWKDENKDTRFYVIYRQDIDEDMEEIKNPKNIIGRIGKEAGSSFIDETLDLKKNYNYGVSIIDEAGKETEAVCITSNLNNYQTGSILFDISIIGLILGGIFLVACCILGIILVSFL